MGNRTVTDFFFYRWRYFIGYSVFGVSLASLLIIAGLYIPGGLGDAEIHSALISEGLSPAQLLSLQPDQLLYLPYRLIQAASIALFGFSSFSIKLPSLIIAFFSAIGLLMLMNVWFKRNVAIIASIVAVTTSHFLLVAQSGHSGILYVFWAVSILLTVSLITAHGKTEHFWILVLCALAALSLYMPLSIYVLIALVATAIFHPHVRHIVFRETPKGVLAAGVGVFLVIGLPLIVGIAKEPSLLLTMFGVPESWSDIPANIKDLFQQYGSFYSPSSGANATPIYGLGVVLLVLLGLYQMFTTKYTTKSYIISFWLVALVPFVVLNPNFITITFVPVMLLSALGVDYLIRSWYRLFPRNPYARVFGLLPLGVLVLGIVVSNVDRYVYGYHYDTQVYSDFNFDLGLINKTLASYDKNTKVSLVVPEQDIQLYSTYALHQTKIKQLSVTTSPAMAMTQSDITLVARDKKPEVAAVPSDILVARSSFDADRFYVYKK